MHTALLPALATDHAEHEEAFAPAQFLLHRATAPWEQREAHALRRAVFCVEQGIFPGDDRDAVDARAQLLVAVLCIAGMPAQVVGTVRIHPEPEPDMPGLWYGSRLAVHPAFRHHARLGSALIRLAVGSARAQGCATFRAHVQSQNVALFERLHWTVLGAWRMHGRDHAWMQAQLAHYPACPDPDAGFIVLSPSRP